MATKLRFPQGSSRSYLLRFLRKDGAPEPLTEATLAGYIKRSVFDADADALVDISSRLSILDDLAGLALLSLLPEDTSDLDAFAATEWEVRATLADGRVAALCDHRGPLTFCPLLGPDVAEPPNDYVEPYDSSAMNTFVLSLPDIVGLTGGQSVKLDGLSSAVLSAMPNGKQVELAFDGGISVRYRIRGRNTPETEYGPSGGTTSYPGGSVILCDNDSARCWELVGNVTKQGLPCIWNPDTLKWHQLLGSGTGEGTATVPAPESSAFLLP